MVHKGSCLCGEIQFKVEGDSQFNGLCHCLHCQKTSGSPFSANACFQLKDLKVTKGTPKRYNTVGDSGAEVERYFCNTCGSTLYTAAAKPGLVFIKISSIDSGIDFFQPNTETYCIRAQTWCPHLEGAVKKEKGFQNS